MRLETFKYIDRVTGWQLAPMDFFQDLTLLVGVSGVGKTRILDAISQLGQIAGGHSARGVAWEAKFSVPSGVQYVWRGEFSTRLSDEDTHADQTGEIEEDISDLAPDLPEGIRRRVKAKIMSEQLIGNGITLIERDAERILLKGNPTPKLSPHQSALAILSQEDDVAPAHEAFHRLLPHDENRGEMGHYLIVQGSFAKHCKKHGDLSSVQESSFPTSYKLALIHACAPEIFKQITDRFIDVFPQVEQVTFEKRKGGFPFGQEYPILKIKERGCDEWIPQHTISAGMLRTLYHLARIALWPDGTVVLIDEFETSLGVNCLDFVTKEVVSESRRLQFIITSHHPYIINNISPKHWKVVTRNGSLVTTTDATSLGIERSSHQAFIQLMNLDRYRNGIAEA